MSYCWDNCSSLFSRFEGPSCHCFLSKKGRTTRTNGFPMFPWFLESRVNIWEKIVIFWFSFSNNFTGSDIKLKFLRDKGTKIIFSEQIMSTHTHIHAHICWMLEISPRPSGSYAFFFNTLANYQRPLEKLLGFPFINCTFLANFGQEGLVSTRL